MQIFIEGTWQQIATHGYIRLRLAYWYEYTRCLHLSHQLPDTHLRTYKVSRNQC